MGCANYPEGMDYVLLKIFRGKPLPCKPNLPGPADAGCDAETWAKLGRGRQRDGKNGCPAVPPMFTPRRVPCPR